MQRGLAQREIHSNFVPWRARQKHRRAAARSAASKPSARLAALRSSQSSKNHARAHARTEAGRAHSGRSTPGLPHPARVGFVTAATLNAATHGPALAQRWPNAGRTLRAATISPAQIPPAPAGLASAELASAGLASDRAGLQLYSAHDATFSCAFLLGLCVARTHAHPREEHADTCVPSSRATREGC